jgi:hypothetical protein
VPTVIAVADCGMAFDRLVRNILWEIVFVRYLHGTW